MLTNTAVIRAKCAKANCRRFQIARHNAMKSLSISKLTPFSLFPYQYPGANVSLGHGGNEI
jgi:hypothetical protein